MDNSDTLSKNTQIWRDICYVERQKDAIDAALILL
jgi:hypothetical protein